MEELQRERKRLQGLMVFFASVSAATEKVFGSSAEVISSRAGKQLGAESVGERGSVSEGDILKGVEEFQAALKDMGMIWEIEPWKKSDAEGFVREENGKKKLNLVFRDCIIRNALFHCRYSQEKAPCQMSRGYFVGAMETLTGGKAELEVLHAGDNACLMELTWEDGK